MATSIAGSLILYPAVSKWSKRSGKKFPMIVPSLVVVGTVTGQSVGRKGACDDTEFAKLRAVMEDLFPLVHQRMERRIFSDDCLVYGLEGDGIPTALECFKERGLTFEVVLDEGGAIIDPPFAGMTCKKCAMVAVHEKGLCKLNCTASAANAPAAIRRCGLYQGGLLRKKAGGGPSLKGLKKTLFSKFAQWVFEMDTKRCDDDHLNIDFHYGPLVKAWQKQGCSDEEIRMLCDHAMCGDRGIAESFGCELDLPTTIARGDDICQIRFVRR